MRTRRKMRTRKMTNIRMWKNEDVNVGSPNEDVACLAFTVSLRCTSTEGCLKPQTPRNEVPPIQKRNKHSDSLSLSLNIPVLISLPIPHLSLSLSHLTFSIFTHLFSDRHISVCRSVFLSRSLNIDVRCANPCFLTETKKIGSRRMKQPTVRGNNMK